MEARQLRNMALVLVALILVALALERPWSHRGPGGDERLYPDFEAAKIDRIHIVNRADTVDLVRRDDVWLVNGPRPLPADTAMINRALEAVVKFETTQLVSKNTSKFEVFQVDSTNAVHAEFYAGGDRPIVDVLVGKMTPDGGTYFRPAGEVKVYSAPDRVRMYFGRSARQWPDRKIFNADPAAVSKLTIERGDSTIVFEKGTDGTWALKQPLAFPVKTEEMDQLVRTTAMLTAANFPDSAVTPAAAGLERPALRVKAERLDGAASELLVGAQAANNLYYAKTADRDWIYMLGAYQRDLYYKDLLSLKAETPPVATPDTTSAGRPGGTG
jgi:hypothetical protein